jgi:mannosylglycerate hydrolase
VIATRALRIPLVPHTHWDREWYRSFQEFRIRLVALMDDLLQMLEGEELPCFVLDGQMAVVDDYLEARPEALQRLESLAKEGRVTLGPWYVLMDEFLVSGETIVRDLQMGLERARDFGEPMEIGYLPDMFGHVAQMPQILRLAGMGRAVVWRGVPRSVDRARFRWSSPDGSTVLAEYLVHGYGNASALPSDPEAALAVVEAYLEEVAPWMLPDRGGEPGDEDAEPRGQSGAWGAVPLLMNGTDHQMPRRWLTTVVNELNASQERLELAVLDLKSALETVSPGGLSCAPDELPEVAGELRSSARANLLMGVSSNRVDVKQAAARAERALERRAEPLWALFGEQRAYPSQLLAIAWKNLVLNSAHDSSCACSVDEVVEAVLHRYREARQIAEGLASVALESFSRSLDFSGAVLINLSSRPRRGVVSLELPIEGDADACPPGCQFVSSRPSVLVDAVLDASSARLIMEEVRTQQVDDHTFIVDLEIEDAGDVIEVSLRASDRLERELAIEPIKKRLCAMLDARPDAQVHVRMTQPPRLSVLSPTGSVPGYGWAPWEPCPPANPVEASGWTMSNGIVSVSLDEEDGTFSVNGLTGFNRLVDGGDHGDTYNYSPPVHDLLIDSPLSVSLRTLEAGPVRATIEVRRTYRWPEYVDDLTGHRIGEREVEVVSLVSLCAGDSLVAVETSLDNTCRDHRLRALFPLPSPAMTSVAECAFAVVERPIVAEGGPTERGLATYPSRRFVSAGGLTVVHDGLLEYELVSAEGESITGGAGGNPPPAEALALTLLRATGMLSRMSMQYRPVPAGPSIAVRGAQMPGPQSFRYGVHVGGRDPYELAEDFLLPLEVVVAGGRPTAESGRRPATGQAIRITGGQVSSLRRIEPGGAIEIRAFNPSSRPSLLVTARPDGRPLSGRVVDLRGESLSHFPGEVELAPWKIVTVRVDL